MKEAQDKKQKNIKSAAGALTKLKFYEISDNVFIKNTAVIKKRIQIEVFITTTSKVTVIDTLYEQKRNNFGTFYGSDTNKSIQCFITFTETAEKLCKLQTLERTIAIDSLNIAKNNTHSI